jgi:hypothetical protein
MNIVDKIVSQVTKPTQQPLGPADREHLRVQQQQAEYQKRKAERERAEAIERKCVADDIEHYAEHRKAFIRRENPSETALKIFDANQELELAQRIVSRTNPQRVTLNDGSLGTHPSVGRVIRAKAALKQAVALHERMRNITIAPIAGQVSVGAQEFFAKQDAARGKK